MAKKRNFKYWTGRLHLWLGLASGLIVCFLGITGCILAFEQEIRNVTEPYRIAEVQNKPLLSPSALKNIANNALTAKYAPHSIAYEPGKAAQAVYYHEEPDYYWIVYINPYSGQVLKVKDMDTDFFRFVVNGHYYLWLPPTVGQPILASATLIFVVLLISGIVLWWPKNRAAAKQRFTIKLNARWRRVNYDMHNVLGFYMAWVIIFIALSGLVMGFQWFAGSVYWITSGGKKQVAFYEAQSDTTLKAAQNLSAIDQVWNKTRAHLPGFTGSIDVHIPENNKAAIEVAINPDTYTYWKTDYVYYDQYTLKEIPVKHSYGKFKKASAADKLARMNYDIHVGAIVGLPGKIMAFCASLIAASMPVTGFIIWWGRRKTHRLKAHAPSVRRRAMSVKV